MKKRLLVIKEVGVREPKLVCYTVVQGQVQVQLTIGQTLISPALLEIHCDGVVLGRRIGDEVTDKKQFSFTQGRELRKQFSKNSFLLVFNLVFPARA